MLVTIVLVLLILMLFGGGQYLDEGTYRGPGFGLGGVLLIVLLLTGRI